MKQNETKGQVYLDTFEILWLYRTLVAALTKKEKEEGNSAKKLKNHTGYQLGKALSTRLGKLKDATIVNFNRKEARLMCNFIPVTIEHLKAAIIPAYEKRIQEHPDKKEYYVKYLDSSRSLVIKLEKLKERLDVAT